MKRRGFLASLLGLFALGKMPLEETVTPVVAPAVIDPLDWEVVTARWDGTTMTVSTGGMEPTYWVRADDVDGDWSYTENGSTGVTLTLVSDHLSRRTR